MKAAPIRQAIRDVLEGASGRYASRMAGLFVYGTFDGQPAQTTAALALRATHTFDVVLGEVSPHEASPAGVRGSYRLQTLLVTVRVWTRLPPANAPDKRSDVVAGVSEHLDLAILALGEPEALTYTAGDEATGIVSGIMRSPDGTGYPDVTEGEYDWQALLATHEIRGRAIVRVDRP